MIDGIYIAYAPPNKDILKMDFWEHTVNRHTGLKTDNESHAKIKGLNLSLKESVLNTDTGLRLDIKGSVHKFFNQGKSNADRFTFENLQISIDRLCTVLNIEPQNATIHNLEIGLNIPIDMPVNKILKNIVSYGNKDFYRIDEKSNRTGLQCSLSQYKVKIYNKGKQSKTKDNILRFEVSFNKMQPLAKYGINTISDLKDKSKIYALRTVLIEALSRIVWTDSTANLNKLNDREIKQWLYYSNPHTWQNMNKSQRHKAGKQWALLLSKYGNLYDLKSDILKEWNKCFNIENATHEANKKATFLPLEYKGKTPPDKKEDIKNKGYIKSVKNTQPPHRHCLSCNSDISHQRPNSLFCSEKYVGKKKAKQCRNKNSNHRKNLKHKIKTAMQKNKLLAITYKADTGERYTDFLFYDEIEITKDWLDRIEYIQILDTTKPPKPPLLKVADEAKEYLKSKLIDKPKNL